MSASREFFHQVVKPTCDECLKSIADLRRSQLTGSGSVPCQASNSDSVLDA
jgi:hypothetical protein